MEQQSVTRPDFYTLEEVGALLRLSRTSLWRMRKRGEVPVVFLGGRPKVPRRWVESLSESESH
ncbi:helix-turn-helix domain-containing protein [Nocardioides jensenii]|uniref:helix-turn-helix domain-containing protein n=1 Tax=Nocardioides jensenii TaxID=1843 RepID=UPI003898D6DB